MRRMAQSLQMKDARIAELERKLARAAAAAGAVVDEAEDEAAMGPRPSMLEAPPTADESWPQVRCLCCGQQRLLPSECAAGQLTLIPTLTLTPTHPSGRRWQSSGRG